jgi:large subunit ribosomal protein L21
MKSFAIIETGGKQYIVSKGDTILCERLGAVEGPVSFEKVLLKSDGKEISVGDPYISGAVVSGTILSEKRDKKKIVFRFHSKTRYRKLKGHRQTHATVTITEI